MGFEPLSQQPPFGLGGVRRGVRGQVAFPGNPESVNGSDDQAILIMCSIDQPEKGFVVVPHAGFGQSETAPVAGIRRAFRPPRSCLREYRRVICRPGNDLLYERVGIIELDE